MGIKLIRDAEGNYRRTWYAQIRANGALTNRKLATPLRGKIPLDADGRFSLSLTGDPLFEKSKAEAKAELQEIIDRAKTEKAEELNAPGHIERQVYRKLTGENFQTIPLATLAKRNAQRQRYTILKPGDKSPTDGHPLTEKEAKAANKYNQSVADILDNFAKFCAAYSAENPKRKCTKITDIGREIVAAYYEKIAAAFSWQTFRKYVFTLASVYRYYMPPDIDDPFAKVYEDEYKSRKQSINKTSVVHDAPTEEQIRQIWNHARTMTDKPYLYRIAVAAACTGMRIGDVCNLTWDKIDLREKLIRDVKTAKTGAKIGVPLFDYQPDAEDFDAMFGELRRELEAALAERKPGDRYVFPQAAEIYNRDPSRINKLGKALFARALFADDNEPEDAVLAGEEPKKKTPVKILEEIKSANMSETKKERLLKTYELYATGKTYGQIAAAIGNGKGNVSDDLRAVEELTGQHIRPGNPYMGANAKPTLRALLKRTRTERGAGQRAACKFGWHSFRVAFVVMAMRAGMKPDDLRLIVGHSTVRMVMHYYNPEEIAAAHEMRRQVLRKKKTDQRTITPPTAAPQIETRQQETPATTTTAPATPAAPANAQAVALQAMFAILTDEQKQQLAAALLGSTAK